MYPLFEPNLRETKSFLEESLMRFFQICTDSLIVCADCVGMSGSVKEMLKQFEECQIRAFFELIIYADSVALIIE